MVLHELGWVLGGYLAAYGQVVEVYGPKYVVSQQTPLSLSFCNYDNIIRWARSTLRDKWKEDGGERTDIIIGR
jgi:hypothetical protein